MKALFISEETLLDNSIINENVSYTQIRPTVIKVQEMRIQPIVGSPLYGELVTQVVSGTTTARARRKDLQTVGDTPKR